MAGITASDFRYIRDLVQKRSAIQLSEGKEYLVENRLLSLANKEGFGSIQELVNALRTGRKVGLVDKIIESMTTHETSFFRDMHPFEVLRKEILPGLIQKRSTRRTLNIWCAACSSGQEPYSIAITLRQHFPMLNSWNIKILATDISNAVLDKAKEGTYRQFDINRGLPASVMVRYFQRRGTQWTVKPEIRDMITFKQLNLVSAWPPLGMMDVVMLRNVLIYFDVNTKRNILKRASRVLQPDGTLFLGAAETTMNLSTDFERIQYSKASCYQLRRSGGESHVYI